MSSFKDYDEVYPNIFIGGADASKDKQFIKEENIEIIVNCTKDLNNYFEPIFLNSIENAPLEVQNWIKNNTVKYYRLSIDDNGKKEELDNFYKLSHSLISKLEKEYQSGKRILIHCLAGAQRSCSLTAYLLMKITNKNLEEVSKLIINKRKQAFCFGKQFNFLEPLKLIEKELYKIDFPLTIM
jgi:hypothetical protein